MHVSILVGRRRRFWSSQAASAAAQCLFLAFAIWLFPSGHDIQISASNYATLYVFAAPRISYQPQTATKLQSKETGGVTGLPTAPRATLAHPSLPRAARLQKIDDVM